MSEALETAQQDIRHVQKPMYLIVGSTGMVNQTTDFSTNANTLGRVYDGLIKVFRVIEGRFQRLAARGEEKPRFRWVAEWEDVSEQ
jgi:hypothetical protein